MVNWKKNSFANVNKRFCSLLHKSFLKCKSLHSYFSRILLIDLELPALKMDFLKDFFNNFVGRFQIATYLTTESSQKYFLTKKNSSVLIFVFLYHLGIPTWACMFT